jgi:alpha-1,3-mannosyl-glycoprotein beta-1,2-N-acetylglucosaminyltransferase
MSNGEASLKRRRVRIETEPLSYPLEEVPASECSAPLTRSCRKYHAPSIVDGRCAVSWKFLVRWLARGLLVLFFFLSSANVVRISDLTEASPDTGGAPSSGTVLLVVAHARPQYLERCLKSILESYSRCSSESFWPIVVSVDLQDGKFHEDVLVVAENFGRDPRARGKLTVWQHEVSYGRVVEAEGDSAGWIDVESYRRISRHYKWALHRAFGVYGADRVVVVEEDMEVSSDFFGYFDGLSPLLEADPTLFCVSAWNDNGKQHLALDSKQLHRTDFFPGLGWMLTSSLWDEIAPLWPDIYWDDWLRSTKLTRGRQCIRPEVSRTANFGAEGVSRAFNHEKHVAQVVLNQQAVNFSILDLTYLNALAYERLVFGRMSRAVLLKYTNYLTSRPQEADVIVRHPAGSMDQVGKRTGVMTDHREGRFRTSYRGVVIIPWNGHWAFLVARDWEAPAGYTLGASVCC